MNIPQSVTDLAAIERGSKIIIQFTLPRLTTEGVAIKPPLHWDLRVGETGTGEFRMEEWAARAKAYPEVPPSKGHVYCEIPAAPWIGKDVVISVRTKGASGRESAWPPKPLVLTVIAPPAAPYDLKAENVREGVRLTWSGAGPSYAVVRRAESDANFARIGTAETPEFVDGKTEYGKTYHYVVEAIAKTGTADVQSDLSPELIFTPKDIFPPGAPAGLTAVPTTNTIELTWDRNTEPDLAGYRIYRAALPDGQFEMIGETREVPSYTDRKVESAKQYRYTVRAFDNAGNLSEASAAVEGGVP